MHDVQMWLLVLALSKGEVFLPTQPVAYATQEACDQAAARINIAFDKQGRVIQAECTPLLVVPR